MSVRINVGLGFNNYTRENELGRDDSAFCVFNTNSEDVEGRPLFNSDESSEVNTNDFASSDSSVKSSKPKPNDSTSCASTSSVSTSENEAKIELNDCDFYEKQIVNKTVGIGVGPVHSRNTVNHQNQFVPQPVLLRTGKVNIPPARPQPVPTGKPKVFAPVPTGRQNRPFPVPTDRGYSPSVIFDWWKRTARPMPHDSRPTSSYFQTYTPYVPTMYYNHMKYGGDRWETTVKPSAGCFWKSHRKGLYWENPFPNAEDEGVFDSGCSRSMTGNKERLDDFQAFQGGKVTFGGGEGRITGKGTIRTPTLDFENVYYVKELQQFNLFSISQIYDKKNRVLFTNTECLVLSKDFKLLDESMVVLRVPRKHNLYTINLNNLCHRGNLACLVAHASVDESMKWHRRMGHVNYKNMNRLVKGKQHKASYKAIHAVSSISEPLQLLHMDLFGPTSIRSIDHKYYCLVIIDDYNKFCWVFFLEHKDETYSILKEFIHLVENQLNKKVKAMRCDNGTEFKNAYIIEFYRSKGIKREYRNARTPQQNKVAERKNKTLIEAARTMLADSKLPTMFWTEAVRTACYVLNRVLADEGYIVGYSASNKAYRVYNVPNKRVEETMNLRFLEEKPNVQGLGYEWYFNLDYLTDTLGYKHVQANQSAGAQEATTNPAGTEPKHTSGDEVDDSPLNSADEIFQKKLTRLKGQEQRATYDAESFGLGFANDLEELQKRASEKIVPPGSIPVPTGSIPVHAGDTMVSTDDVPVHTSSSTDSFFNDEPTTRFPTSTVEVSPVATKQINTIHPQSLIIKDHTSAVQTRSKVKQTTTDFQHCLFACFLSQVEPRSVAQALEDPSWVDAMQEEMQQFKFQNVWVLVDLPKAQGHRQEEGIDYDEVFALVAGIEAIRLFLAFASYMGFMVYQMDIKSAFLYVRIDEEVYVTQPKGFVDPQHPKKVYKVVKALYGLHQAPRAWFTSSTKTRWKFYHQDKYVQEILNKFDLGSVRTTTTPYEAPKIKSKNESDSLVNVHLYRSTIGSLMYLTTSRPDIMFVVSACSRNQVTPTTSNLEAVKKIFKYLKGQPKL
nr:putative ribonuclease H-like domain-containing protein [Tanacetum cinerariifolium]